MHAQTATTLAAVSLLIALGSGCGGGSAGTPEQDAGHALPDARPAGAPDAAQAGAPDASTGPDGGCIGETDLELCALHDAQCGTLFAGDRCGATRQVADCGGCPSPQTCGGGGAANVCGTRAPEPDCGTAPLRTTGTVYYFCDCQTGAGAGCRVGDDANPGTTPSAPRRTLAEAASQFRSMNAGDTVALCRAGAWDERFGGLTNERCTGGLENSCDLRDYVPVGASTSSALPRINFGSANAIEFYFQTAMDGIRIWNLDFHPGFRAMDAPSVIQIYDDKRNIDICNIHAHDGGSAILAGSTVTNLTIRNSTFTRMANQALYLETPYLTLDSNVFTNNGDQRLDGAHIGWYHTIYWYVPSDNALPTGGAIRNNVFQNDADGTWGVPGGGACAGVMVILRGIQSGVTVENNLFSWDSAWGCMGFNMGQNGVRASLRDVKIRRNRFLAGPNADGAVGLTFSACPSGCEVTDNLVDVRGSNARGIVIPEKTSQDDALDDVTGGAVVRNNSVRVNGASTLVGIVVGRGTEGQDYVVENNAVWVAPGGTCFEVDRPTLADHPFSSTTHPDAAANPAGNYCMQGGDPGVLWSDPANGDFRPSTGGPLIGKGNTAGYSPTAIGTVQWSPTDSGTPRSPPIDIGAMVH